MRSRRRQLLELIETILVYKFPTMSREEIEGMFGLSDLKQTRVYQEGVRQEKLRMIPLLFSLALSFEETAKELDLSLEDVISSISK
ncbi:hypothetical protein NIES25_10880 [Nostoc linckia NIES-25]|nr:hypothetical protein NIES25_10880 [Nostoc linckia NIES-25]